MSTAAKDMTIREVLELHPGTARILTAFGMHCLGCPHAIMETLEQAGAVHGIDVDEMVRQLNDYLEGNPA